MNSQPPKFHFSIYTLSNPMTGIVFYVGCTVYPLRCRNQRHKAKGRIGNIEGIEEIHCTKVEALKIEAYWIQQFIAWGFPLVNKENNARVKIVKKRIFFALNEKNKAA